MDRYSAYLNGEKHKCRSIVANPVGIGKNTTADGVGNNKVDRAKVDAKMAKFKSQDKNKSKNSAKSKALIQSFGLGFLSFKARQAFTKLR